jgi:DNA-binding CsgD family transcriptional regulator
MTRRISISTADLRRLCAVTDKAHWADCGDGVPHTLLQALQDVVPCDEITYQVTIPTQKTFVYLQDLDGTACCYEQDKERFEAFFWPAFWSSLVCSYPQQSDAGSEVHGVSDFLTDSEFHRSPIGELFRVQQSRYNMLIPLAYDGETDYRIELWREPGTDFSEREQMLMTLLRPHLAELDRSHRLQRRQSPLSKLTARQVEVLKCVASGSTNRQVARRLSISEGTVRRHLEDIYQRLEVASRTAAAALVTEGTTTDASKDVAKT